MFEKNNATGLLAPVDISKMTKSLSGLLASGQSDPHFVGNYIEALGMYFVVAIVLSILCVVGCLNICMCKYVCNCPICGRRVPTAKGDCRCLPCLGFERADHEGIVKYSAKGVMMTRAMMASLAFFLALWMLLGQVGGNQGMTKAMVALTKAPDGLQSLLQGTVGPISSLLENVIGDSIVIVLAGLNHTLTSEVNLQLMVNKTDSILNNLQNLPSLEELKTWVSQVDGTMSNLTGMMSSRVPGAISSLIAQLNQTTNATESLRNTIVNSYKTLISNLLSNISMLQNNTKRFNAFTSTLTNSSCCASKASSELSQLSNNTLLPSAVLTSASNDAASIAAMQAGYASNKQGQLNTLNQSLASVTNLPNYSLTAARLRTHNLNVQQAISDGVASDLVVAMQNVSDFLKSTNGSTATLNASIQGLLQDVKSINLTSIRQIVQDFNATMDTFPSFQVLTNWTRKILAIRDSVIPDMLALIGEIMNFNASVAALPSEMSQLYSVVEQVNSSMSPAIEYLDKFNKTENDYLSAKDSFNISKQLESIASTETKLADSINNVSADSIINKMQVAEQKACSLDIGILPMVISLQDQLATWQIDNTTINNTENLALLVADLRTELLVAVADGALWYKYCGDNLTQACELDADCGTGVCLVGSDRCRSSSLACSADADCTGDRCLVDAARKSRLSFLLSNLALATQSPVPAVTKLDGIRNNATIDTSALDQGGTEANQTLSDINTGKITDSLDSTIASLKNFDTSTFSSQVQAINKTLTMIDFSATTATINSMDAAFNQTKETKNQMQIARDFLNATQVLVSLRLPQVIQDFKYSTLKSIRESSGVAATLAYLASHIDEETMWLDANSGGMFGSSNSSNGSGFSTNFTFSLAPYKSLVYALADDPSTRSQGSIFYLMKIINGAQGLAGNHSTNFFEPDGSEDRLDVDLAGKHYPNSSKCFTAKCLTNFITWFNQAPFSEVSQEVFGMTVPTKMSREQLIGLPYLLPLAICLCAAASALLICHTPFCRKISTLLACCSCVGSCCCMPFAFIFAGLLFPLVILSGDLCFSLENVGYSALSGMGPDVCTSVGGLGTSANCSIPWTFNNETHYVQMDLLDVYSSVIGGGCDPAQGGIHDAFDNVALVLGQYPNSLISGLLDGSTGPITFREPVKDIMRRGALSLSGHLGNFSKDLGAALSCRSLHLVFKTAKSAVCCETVSALYWAIGSWYLIAFTLFFCGWAPPMMARKRFAHSLWGKEVKQAEICAPRKSEFLRANDFELASYA